MNNLPYDEFTDDNLPYDEFPHDEFANDEFAQLILIMNLSQ